MAGEEEDDLPCSQFSLGLSQGTLNNLLEAAADSNNDIIEEYFVTDQENPQSLSMDGPSSITIQRSLITPTVQSNMNLPSSQHFVPSTCTPSIGYPPPLHHTEPNSVISSANTTPTRNVSPGMSECSSSGSYRSHISSLPFMQKKVPSNMPFTGEYGFALLLPEDDDKPSKTTPFTYSSLTKRAYIRRDTTIALTFSFTKVPPHSVIRAMAIHKTAELLGEVLQCCPKHIEEQKKKGHQHPRHFICGASKSEAVYCEDPISGRLSITIPVNSLQQKSEDSVQSFFTFPCFTSEIHKGPGQLAQLIFTLEIEGHIVGRAVIDVRVCASTGRDRDNDESKLSTSASNTPSEENNAALRLARKRPSSLTQNLECTLPSKIACPNLSIKQQYTVETYPELFPFIDVCVKMIERVYACKIPSAEVASDGASAFESNTANALQDQQQSLPTITDIDNWLQFINLTQYGPTLARHGICNLSQVIELTDERLLTFGIKDESHRKILLDGIKYIPIADQTLSPQQSFSQSTQPYHPQLLSQLSSVSSAASSSSTPSKTLDVLRIQMKKTFSNSSSSSNGE